MKKTELSNSREQYVAPCCNVLNVETEGVLCASYGEYDEAGNPIEDEDWGIF
ncbi:MAG: hypothetical protein NC308_03940 [Clostridium sp.]|nr:hypothetical protein [Bacteroides sp.]MCM1198019.1 hypothetical protein [Clostridium sp.]